MLTKLHINRIIPTALLLIAVSAGLLGQDHPPAVSKLCDDTRAIIAQLNAISDNPEFIAAKAAIMKAAADRNEHGLVLGKDSSGTIIISAMMSDGTKNSSPIDISFPGAFADLHNHPGNTSPSAGDIYNLIKLNKDHSSLAIRFTVLANGTFYAIVITDRQKADSFVRQYPSEQSAGFSPRFPEKLFNEFADIKSFLINIQDVDRVKADEMATAFMLDKYNCGVALFVYTGLNEFVRIIVSQTTGSRGQKAYHTKFCPE